jgi:hypothetical protein
VAGTHHRRPEVIVEHHCYYDQKRRGCFRVRHEEGGGIKMVVVPRVRVSQGTLLEDRDLGEDPLPSSLSLLVFFLCNTGHHRLLLDHPDTRALEAVGSG